MKLPPPNSLKLTFLIALVFAASGAAAQSIISINIMDAAGNNPMAGIAGLSADGTRVGNWNDVSSSASQTTILGADLVYDNGATVGGSFEITMDSDRATFVGAAGLTNDPQLYAGFTQIRNGESISFDLSGIPFSTYDIYIYTTGGNNNRGGSISLTGETTYYNKGGSSPDINGNGYTAITTTAYDPGNPGNGVGTGNFVKYSSLSGATKTLTLETLDMGDASLQRHNIYGFQIVAVPEPATYAIILGIFALGLVSRRLRTNRR